MLPTARARLLADLTQWATQHPEVASAAHVGSTAEGFRDRHSDIDLALGTRPGVEVAQVLAQAESWLADYDPGFARLLDIPYEDAVYRVFLHEHGMQLDVSARPQTSFAATTARFALVFGETGAPAPKRVPDMRALVAEAVLYVRLAGVAHARRRPWQAAHFVDTARARLTTALCLRYGTDPFDGRGFDDLPPGVLAALMPTMLADLSDGSVARAIGGLAEGCLASGSEGGLDVQIERYLHSVTERYADQMKQ